MAKKSDMKRPQSVNAEFDDSFDATSNGGEVLVERVLRRLGLRRHIDKLLPKRSDAAKFSMVEGLYALMCGLLVGGRGIKAAETLRKNRMDSRIFGLENGAPSEGSMHNILGDMAGLAPRKLKDAYTQAGPCQPSLDMFGREATSRKLRRVVPDEPEAALANNLQMMWTFTAAVALRCLKTIKSYVIKVHGFTVVFCDATALEVDGRCFDAAEQIYTGARALLWSTIMVGPIIVAESLGLGARDEAKTIPALLSRAKKVVDEIKGRFARVLSLLDAAYFEKEVVEELREMGWKFIICANRLRGALERIAAERPELFWHKTGPDERRGWADSQFCVFSYRPEGWDFDVTIMACRSRETDDLPGTWRYSFLGTNFEIGDLPKHRIKKHGYARYIWMLYSTKQGRENHYKTALTDFGLHHPPSSRLGIDQAFYAVGSAAANIAMVIRYRVVRGDDRGIRFWRFRERYIRIAGRIVEGGRTLTVRMSGACVDVARQALWLSAFSEAALL